MEINSNKNIFESSTELSENYDPKKNKTLPIITKYEKTRIIGIRMQQLAQGCKPYIDISELSNQSYDNIALEELKKNKLPFILKRRLPNGIFEYWKLDDMDIL
jgi:DNA-directed RNA polymerases I, II, and III subunit RPABC2